MSVRVSANLYEEISTLMPGAGIEVWSGMVRHVIRLGVIG